MLPEKRPTADSQEVDFLTSIVPVCKFNITTQRTEKGSNILQSGYSHIGQKAILSCWKDATWRETVKSQSPRVPSTIYHSTNYMNMFYLIRGYLIKEDWHSCYLWGVTEKRVKSLDITFQKKMMTLDAYAVMYLSQLIMSLTGKCIVL